MSSKSVTMTLTSEIQRMLPPGVRRMAGFQAGDLVEVQTNGGIVTLIPKLPTADDEYTPAQRHMIKAELTEARKGPQHGPFKSAEEFATYFKEFKSRGSSTKPQKNR